MHDRAESPGNHAGMYWEILSDERSLIEKVKHGILTEHQSQVHADPLSLSCRLICCGALP